MEQDTNREYLKKLLYFLRDRILSNPSNQWFAKDLYKLLAPASDAKISDIHEQCIESILQQQAAEFYKDFVIEALRPQLIADFVKMEHWRRRNNVQEFCMALYQQIEAITNYLGADENLNLIWKCIRNAGFFVDYESNDIRVRFNGEKSKSIKSSIIYKSENYDVELKKLAAMDKFKAILFLIAYGTGVNNKNVSLFTEDFNLGLNIYMVRNLNHRGNIIDNYTSNKIAYIIKCPTYAMCSLLGFFAHFVSCINKHFPISKELIELAENCCKK